MSAPLGYYDESYPPELWETPAAPAPVALASAPDEAPAVTSAVAAGAPAPALQERTAVPGEPLPELPASAYPANAQPLAGVLTVAAGTPGTYSPAVTAAQRPRNVTELRATATPAAPEPWAPGSYVLVGENGKRAHWDGKAWQRGDAPALTSTNTPTTVPDGTVPPA